MAKKPLRQFTARARCTVTKHIVIEARSQSEAERKAEEWDCVDERESEQVDYEILEVREQP